MPRVPQLMTGWYPYHVTARSNNKEWFFLPLQDVWRVTVDLLARVREIYSVEIISYVLMSNHFHILVQTPLGNIDRMMNYFQREVSREICRRAGRINHVFGGRYKSSLICDEHYFAHAYKYVYRNPIQAQLANKVEDFPYSSLNWILQNKAPFPLMDTFNLYGGKIPVSILDRLSWLNVPYSSEQEAIVKKALRRVTCQFTRNRNKQHLVSTLLS